MGLSCLGSFIRSNMYLLSYRGSTQLKDSESESLDLTSSYVIFFPKILIFPPATQKTIIKVSQLLGCCVSGRCPRAGFCMSRVLHEQGSDFSNDPLITKLCGNIFFLYNLLNFIKVFISFSQLTSLQKDKVNENEMQWVNLHLLSSV